ncbi:hypothetical protein GQ43DRAFT_409921 [Delitschia confertaspora ATCC 74209]|uniref:Uncharacterized protein n=1 Tax=Delitschia confertaspora ATCC 74209 TaxID=1513339 RepID=A0A9P4N1W4_9PLEO|nr:hypothetical protein GQ43DRAFT_409921 [Delitschia confertaspora ATCC 74209]
MLNFRPLQVAKRKIQTYATVPTQDHDVENAYNEKRYESDNDSDYPSSVSSPYSSRASSGAYNPMLKTTSPAKPTVSAYSYRNPRAFTRYFGLAIGATLVFFILFLTHNSWSSARSVQLGLEKPPPPPPVWENFPFLKRYYGGLRTLTPRDKNKPEYPLQEDVDHDGAASKEKEQKEKEEKKLKEHKNIPPSEAFNPYPQCNGKDCYEECFLDANDTIRIPPLQVYNGVPAGMPENIYGSYEVLGLRNDVCFDRFGRLGPYGFGYSRKYGGLGAGMEGEREGSDNVWKEVPQVDFRSIKWGDAQHRCVEKNKARASDETPKIMIGDKKIEKATNMTETRPAKATQKQGDTKNLLPRNCVLIRTWWDYNYDEEDLVYLRALIAELGIQSGGEYTVHFLIHVKDDNKQIWADDDVYQEVLKKSLPEEFEGMGTLWSERQMGLIYGGVEESMYRNLPVHGAYRSTFMPVTYFAHLHPEFDYYWHWEMDVRYTGHYYHLFSQVSKWAAQQPRKLLWERNARFYIPQAHGTWEDFTHMVRVQTEHGTNNKANTWSSHLPPNPHVAETEPQKPEKPIWGPEVPLDYPDIEIDETLKPPSTYAEDKYTWGVNEEADLITFNPLFDPDHTNWILAEDVTGYNKTRGLPPRRTAINTSGRLSRRLLETMHREQSLHRHTMFSEMWPASCALHHGLKAVYAPHPVFIDRKWPVQYLAAIFNNGRNGASGGARLSVFSDERQNNFRGSSWYYDAGFPGNLWKRWLGFKVDGGGGEEEEMSEEGEGRMCLPGVLLHPVKQVDLIIEKKEGEK